MRIAELTESQLKTLVIISGGFHPYHQGHFSLYQQACAVWPRADVYVAATNDTSERPFPFEVKEQLATIAGVPRGHFVQVKSPFQAREITSHYDPHTTQLIFVRSEKDRSTPPIPGGKKRDGTDSYLQPWSENSHACMDQHAYIAYLKTIDFKVGNLTATSATEIRKQWPISNDQQKTAIVRDLYPRIANNPKMIQHVKQLLTQAIGTVAEAAGVGAIANKKQVNDPRYSMSITKDVKPNTLNRELAAFFPQRSVKKRK